MNFMQRVFLAGTLATLVALTFCSLSAEEPGEVPVQNSTLSTQQQSPESSETKFSNLFKELRKKWPSNRTVRFVFHGHSVPAGYFKTPTVQRFDSYPMLFHKQLCQQFTTATIDCCVTAIGGENSVAGAQRFSEDVLALKPDVVFIDYALNDRGVGLEKARDAWEQMIQGCVKADILVVLLTPTPDSNEDINDSKSRLNQHAAQVRKLGDKFEVPVVDSFAQFQAIVASGKKVDDYLSQPNHPNRKGHEIVAKAIMEIFTEQ
jgi:lysophospholipase L1-like esterase